MSDHQPIPLPDRADLPEAEMIARSEQFLDRMRRRHTVREFSDRPVPRAIIENCLRAAGTAPSGANQQPWHFCVVEDPDAKHRIRIAAEEEERAFYAGRAGEEWLDALRPIGTDADKPFLDIAPWLITTGVALPGNRHPERVIVAHAGAVQLFPGALRRVRPPFANHQLGQRLSPVRRWADQQHFLDAPFSEFFRQRHQDIGLMVGALRQQHHIRARLTDGFTGKPVGALAIQGGRILCFPAR